MNRNSAIVAAIALGSLVVGAGILWGTSRSTEPVPNPRPIEPAPAPTVPPVAKAPSPVPAPAPTPAHLSETEQATTELKAENQQLKKDNETMAGLLEPRAEREFPPEFTPEAFDALQEQWEASCPALGKAVVDLADCEEYPCIGRVSWIDSDATMDEIWCDPSVIEKMGRRQPIGFVFEDHKVQHVMFTFGERATDPELRKADGKREAAIVLSIADSETP